MAKLGRSVFKLMMGLVVLIPLVAASIYVINPFDTRSYDPRLRILGYGPYRIPSRSMAPTVYPDQIVIVSAVHYLDHEPQRGDIVVFLNASDGNVWIKRIVGLPGEQIEIDDGKVLINGQALVETYVSPENATTEYSRLMPLQQVPKDSYFLLGDNRDNSEDARINGPTSGDVLVGKVVKIL